ncbi:Rib/alpha-like domain-containing protein [Gemella haemolysans]|uniref:Rib/alpha-like domain-containing protein n=1 Tax=Gemella haemolysans TaxID=1379 RepID=UPI00237975EB|nr:Rib/alpha-like domain-containing protein [Gemella haemolysans]
MLKHKLDNKIVKYGIKKLSFGIASVAIGAFIFLGNDASAHDTGNTNITSTNIENRVATSNTQNNNDLNNRENRVVASVENRNNLNKNTTIIDSATRSTRSGTASTVENNIVNQANSNGNQSTNNNLNVLDRRTDDSQNIATLLTNIINKNTESNTTSSASSQDVETPVEKGTKIISRLTAKYAEDIAKGYIGLEGGKYDSLIYKKAVLNPDGDDDGDGIANKDELYIYKKDGRTYLGYDIHPRLTDTDGDGLNDKEDRDKLIWNISARDMAMFMNLAYESDESVKNILSNKLPVGVEKDKIKRLTHSELSPYWTVKQTFHQNNGLDAVLFETKNNFPFLKGEKIQVLAFAGTNIGQGGDLKADIALAFGNESNQSEAAKELINSFRNSKEFTNLYITGHSLGGYLALRASVLAEKNKYNYYRETYTFNAPRIKTGGWFWGVPEEEENISNNMMQIGKVKNYFTDNDNIIPNNLRPKYIKNVGSSQGKHSSTSYFESRMNSNTDFNFGTRQNIDGKVVKVNNINNLKIVKPEKGTLSKTFLPKLVDKNPVSVIIGDILKDNDIINKVNRSILPVNTKLTVVKKEGLTSLGTKHAKVKILYLDDNTSNEIDVPILVNEANKQELNSVVNAAHKLIDTIVDLSDKSANSVSNYSLAKTNLSTKLSEASLVLANTLSTQLVINNMTKELARLGMDVINKRTALELTEAGKYSPRLIDDNKILLRQGSNINLDSVVKKIAKDGIPKNINYEIVNNSNLNEIGDINATIKVKYSDNSFDLINIPIRIYTDSKGESLKEEALPELVVSEKGESLKEEALPELVVSEKGESLKAEVLPELVVSEKGESLKAEVLPELVVSEKGESLKAEVLPELVVSEKGESLKAEVLPELVVSEKGESLKAEVLPELVVSEKGESLKAEVLPELVVSEKGESLKAEVLPELVISEKGESLKAEVLPELVVSEKGESLKAEVLPELVVSEKGESLKAEVLPELVVSEKGESLKEEVLPELVVSEKGESLKEEVLPELVVSEKGESLKAEVLPELVVSEKGESLKAEVLPELVVSEKGESLKAEVLPELVVSEKGESLKAEVLPELVVSEKGEPLKEEVLPELVVSEKGESLKVEVLPELVVSEKGESLKVEVLSELVISEKGEVLIQESAPKGKVEKINDDKSGVEVELFNNKIDNISLNVKTVKDTQQLSNISKELSVDKDKVRILDLKLSKDNSIVHLNNERIVRIALLENESSEIEIYHVDKTGKLTLIPSEVNNRIVQFNINHFSLFAIVDFSKKETENKINDKNYIESSSKKEYVYEKIEENSYTVSSDRNENKLTESYAQVEFDENSKNTSKVVSLNNNYKKKESLPKTGENSSEKGISLAGIGLMIGLLGIRRKYRSY